MSLVMFLLPVSGGSGGAHSVMQEADAMRRLGVEVQIIINHGNFAKFKKNYRDFMELQPRIVSYRDVSDLSAVIARANPDIVIATTNQSVHFLADALKIGSLNTRTAYYIQDYEPLFYERDHENWGIAYTSYGLIPNMIHFAKTEWLQEVVQENHLIQVEKVEPSIDHTVYFPDLMDRLNKKERIKIAAMIRPSTPRRAPRRTVRIIDKLKADFDDKIEVITFGCSNEDLRIHSLRLDESKHLGILSREDVGDLFRTTDLFLDMSDFQAFGRTAIEAMSCGSVAVVPAHGGVYEYAVHGLNCLVVDTRDDHAVLSAVNQFVQMSDSERKAMMFQAIQSGFRFTPERAALSEIQVLL